MKKWGIRILILGIVFVNIIAAFHAYKFTHFTESYRPKSQANDLSLGEKMSVVFFGISNPRPVNRSFPEDSFEVVNFQSDEEELEGWWIPVDSAKGNVILFHGYGGNKSYMLSRASLVRAMGYNTLLVDFRGSGGSTGNTTTIGYKESQDVLSAIEYLQSKVKGNIYLLGTSMGAAAVIKAVGEQKTEVKGIIIECPFASLLQASKNRFEKVGVPAFPLAHLLVFWGGMENGFWGFDHSPAIASALVEVPSLLIYGERDDRVKRLEIDQVYEHLKGEKELLLFPNAGHGNYLEVDGELWHTRIQSFLD